MIAITPLNNAADPSSAYTNLHDGIVLNEGFSSSKRGAFSILRMNTAGRVMQPTNRERHVIFSAKEPPSRAEILSALKHPEQSALPVVEIKPASGRVMHRLSQIALALGVVYLSTGLIVGIALPTGLRWLSQYYGGLATTTEERQRIKKVISEFQVVKEDEDATIDDRTKEFFKAIKDAKAGTEK